MQADWRWMKDPLTPMQEPPGPLEKEIRIDMNQEWADCMNILDDRLNDYFCHEALPFLCEFRLPGHHNLLIVTDTLPLQLW